MKNLAPKLNLSSRGYIKVVSRRATDFHSQANFLN